MFGFLKRRKQNDASELRLAVEELESRVTAAEEFVSEEKRLLEEAKASTSRLVLEMSRTATSWPEAFKKHSALCRQELAYCASEDDNPKFWEKEISCSERAYELWSVHFDAVQKRILAEIAGALEVEFPKNGLSDTLKQASVGRAVPQAILEW